jgi:hypothetical protein
MLDGIADNEIVVGAYTHDGGICPMLAAHRNGGRTNFIAFAKAWDRFTLGRSRQRQARPATVRELLVLRSHLEASLLEDDGPAPDLRRAIAEHRELRARAITAPEPIRDPGWRWLRRRRERRTERQLELAERG